MPGQLLCRCQSHKPGACTSASVCMREREGGRERNDRKNGRGESHSDKPQGKEVTSRREEKVLKLYKGTAANDSHFQNALHLRMKSFFIVGAAPANSSARVDGLWQLVCTLTDHCNLQ